MILLGDMNAHLPQHIFSDSQFGFVSGRGTEIATALINDVISYANDRGSTVYTCALDAESSFDSIPHCVLFKKASEVLPDYCWHATLTGMRNNCAN